MTDRQDNEGASNARQHFSFDEVQKDFERQIAEAEAERRENEIHALAQIICEGITDNYDLEEDEKMWVMAQEIAQQAIMEYNRIRSPLVFEVKEVKP